MNINQKIDDSYINNKKYINQFDDYQEELNYCSWNILAIGQSHWSQIMYKDKNFEKTFFKLNSKKFNNFPFDISKLLSLLYKLKYLCEIEYLKEN